MLAAEPALVAAQYQRLAALVLWTVLASLDSVSSLCSQMVHVCIHTTFKNVKNVTKCGSLAAELPVVTALLNEGVNNYF